MRHKLGKIVAVAALTLCAAHAQSFHTNYLKQEFFPDKVRADLLPGGDPGLPASVTFLSTFEVGTLGDNYAQRVSGWFTPAETTDYVFFVAADDDTDLFLSTDADPANKKLIAQEAAWSNTRSWNTPGGGASLAEDKRSDTFALSEWPTGGAAIRLNAGTRYYIEAIHHEGGGGDLLGVTIKKASDPDPANGAEPSTAGGYFSVTAVPLSIVTQPANASVVEGTLATFEVVPSETPAITYQWQVGGVDIPGANSRVYSFTASAADNGKQYRVVLNAINGQTATSTAATLTTTGDTTPPTIGFASAFLPRDGVQVAFSEAMSPTGLTSPASYSISGGVTVNAVEQVSPSSVFLRTTSLTAGTAYTLTVTGLRDQASGGGNLLTPNTATFTPVATPAGTQLNMANYQRWGADEGVSNLDTLEEAIQAGTPPAADNLFPLFEAPVNTANNYAARVRGYFIPPTSGEYVFYGASDDPGRFYISTDSDPANKKLIAIEPSWNGSRDWLGTGNGRNAAAPENRSENFVDSEWPSGRNNIALVAGQPYYVELRFSEGGGGDNGAMTFKLEGEDDPANGTAPRIAGTNLIWFADVSAVAPVFSKTPIGTNYNKGANITLEADAFGAQPITWQWFRNKKPITGATSRTYNIPSADHRHIGDYSVEAVNSVGSSHTKLQDNGGRLLMNGVKFLIEAEDYNYSNGLHVAVSDQMPYRGEAYNGLTPTLDVDFFHDGDNSGANAGAYAYGPRTAMADEGTIETKGPADPADYNRGSFTVTNNYALGWTTTGEWQNYTRVFPQGRYVIYGGHAHDGLDEDQINMIFSRVANPKVPDGSSIGVEGGSQGLTKIGQFLSPATGAWSSNDIIPLTDDAGNLVEVDLNGETTFRLTFNSPDGDADFFLFYCLTCPDDPGPGANVSITRNGNQVTISSSGGGVVEASPTIAPATWTSLGNAPQTVTADGAARYFRIRN